MLLRSQLRWSTLRVMIFTSMVWVIFGMCILVYYMDCLNGKGNCRGKTYNSNVIIDGNGIAGEAQQQQQANNFENSHALRQMSALHDSDIHEENWPYLRLPAYQEIQLHSWKPAGKFFFIFFVRLVCINCFVLLCQNSYEIKSSFLAW